MVTRSSERCAGLRHDPDALRQARMDKGLTQVQLAKLAGCTQPYLSQLECGAQNPSEQMLATLTAFLGCAPDSLRCTGASS